jgi:ubiquinone/menaquinone biosynthesis C-methylase UbiE
VRGRGSRFEGRVDIAILTTFAKTQPMDSATSSQPRSLVLHSAAKHYDLLAAALTLGRERAVRERLADLARLVPGEIVLDVGCGTGSLAIVAKRRVGDAGEVHGIDAAPEMIAQATRKAAKAGLRVAFETGRAEALPFPDAHFDVVFSTLMLHHLPAPVRQSLGEEISRVLKPGGRVIAVDFEPPKEKKGGLISRFHRHGHVPLAAIIELLQRTGHWVVESGSVGISDLQFAVARRPQPGENPPTHVHRSLEPLPAPRWILPAVVVAVLLAHGLLIHIASSAWALSTIALVAVAAVLVAKIGIAHLARIHRRPRE